jgi:hypothetical protein
MEMTAKRRARTNSFDSEADMVLRFVTALRHDKTVFGRVEITTEWDHRSGVVDVLARDREKSLITFEAKLAEWKRAFMQAYRNLSYADHAYVLLPPTVAEKAMLHHRQFESRGIGLCSFDGMKVNVLIVSQENAPLLPWVRKKAHEHLDAVKTVNRRGACGRSAGLLSAARV